MTTITLPDWFCGVFTLGLVGTLIYLGGLLHEVRGICKGFPRVSEALIRISEVLLQKKLTADRVYTASASPVKLTEAGILALKEAKFGEFYAANKKTLLDRIAKANPKTMADLEEVSKQIMLQIEDTLPNFETIKQYSYSHGEPIAMILFACAISLRDLSAKELKISDVPPSPPA
ncbi:MAG: hypothetical protein PHP45_01530 [Elusimicrobiales bacterium]|nr:hypothetical protein [Elusimicrobiales bacterium]